MVGDTQPDQQAYFFAKSLGIAQDSTSFARLGTPAGKASKCDLLDILSDLFIRGGRGLGKASRQHHPGRAAVR